MAARLFHRKSFFRCVSPSNLDNRHMTYIDNPSSRSDVVADAVAGAQPVPNGRGPWIAAAGIAAGAVVVLAIRPNLVATTIASPRALAFVAVVTLAVALVSRLVIARFVHRRLARGVARVGLVGAVAVALLAPSFRDTRVEEALPGATLPAATGEGRPTTADGSTAAPNAAAAATPIPLAAPEAAAPSAPVLPLSSSVTPGVAPAPTTAVPAAVAPPSRPAPAAPLAPVGAEAPVPVPTPAVPAVPPTTAAPVAPTGPVELTRGALAGIGHRAQGTASLYRLPDGRAIVRLEDIDIEPGPDYDVYLVAGAGQRAPSGGRNLGDLRGNQGSQNYDIAGALDEGVTYTVLIWCERFAVPVANATQRPV